jgi:hypothetical protein
MIVLLIVAAELVVAAGLIWAGMRGLARADDRRELRSVR